MAKYSNTLTFSILIGLSISSNIQAQNKTSKIENDRLNKLIATKVSMDKDGVFKDRYTIQLFFGDRENASESKKKYDELKLSWDCDLYWESPNLAVRVGKFRNRLEADRVLLIVREDFPNAIVIKP
jgi:hypothetical protein